MVNWKRGDNITWDDLLGFNKKQGSEIEIKFNRRKTEGPLVPDEILVKMVQEGKTIGEITEITSYRHQTVRTKLRKLGIRFEPKPLKVSDAVLLDLVAKNKCVAEIASNVKMSDSGVRVRLMRLGLDARKDKDAAKKSIQIYDTIVKMKREGYKAGQIAIALKLSPAAISWRMKKLKKAGRL
jgi:DNA-binding transcriptional ArsR family regulator